MRSLSSASSTSMRCALDGVAALQLGRLDRLGAIDLERRGSPARRGCAAAATVFSCAIRAASIASREAMSASSTARLRVISSARTRSSWAMPRGFGGLARGDAGDLDAPGCARSRACAWSCSARDALGRQRPLAGDPRGLDRLLRLDLGFLDRAHLLDFERAGALVGGDAFDIDGHGLGDARLFGRLARRDLGFVDRAGALDLAPARLFLVGDARIGNDAVLLDARLLDRFAGRDLGFLDGPHALDLALAHLALGGDAGGVDRALVGDPRLFDLLAGQQSPSPRPRGCARFPAAGSRARRRCGPR